MPRATAQVGGVVIAQTEQWEFVEGNVYFPPDTIKKELLQPSAHSTYCSWKGDATYNNVVVDGKTLENVVWHYPECFDKAKYIENYYAFCMYAKAVKYLEIITKQKIDKDQGVDIVVED